MKAHNLTRFPLWCRLILRFIYAYGISTSIQICLFHLFRTLRQPRPSYLTINGSRIAMRHGESDWNVFKTVFIHREFEFGPFLSPDIKTIVDLGANVGYSTIYLSHKYPSAKIFAFEPVPETFTVLSKNVRDHNNVSVHEAAVWINSDGVTLDAPKGESWGAKISGLPQSHSTKAKSVTLLEIIEIAGGAIDLLKVDIEGAEYELFNKLPAVAWRNIRNIAIEFHPKLFPEVERAFENAATRASWRFKKIQIGEKLIYKQI